MLKYFPLFLLAIILQLQSVYSSEGPSMRKCTLLPVIDNYGGAVGFKIFESIEKSLKESSWCSYKSNSSVLDILKNYHNDLAKHLESPEVLKVIAEKVDAGSLIKVQVEGKGRGHHAKLKVLGANGSDLYFHTELTTNDDNPEILAQELQIKLMEYEKKIPYDALVLGVLGDQFTIDIGRASYVKIGHRVKLSRLSMKKRHPLLGEIVQWETNPIAEGKIVNVSEFQAQAQILKYESTEKLRKNDFVNIEVDEDLPSVSLNDFPKIDSQQFGKMGQVGVFFAFGSGSSSTLTSGVNKKAEGTVLGGGIEADLWLTRNYLLRFQFDKVSGTLSQSTGNFSLKDNDAAITGFRMLAGYKYLPLGFFYGPQVDGLVGFSQFSIAPEIALADSRTEYSLSGFTLGIRGEIPLMNIFRFYLKLFFLLGPSYSEDVALLGDLDSSSSFELTPGVSYQLTPDWNTFVEYEIRSHSSENETPPTEVNYKTNLFKLGVNFSF